MLSYRLISKEDHPKLRRLLEESFPPEETLPFEFYVSDFRNLGIRVEGVYRENELVGFLHYIVRPEFVYLAFFAFFPKERGKGYGRESLGYLKSLFLDRPICIDRELIDPSLPDNAIRVRRREFYMRSGLFDQNSYQVQNGIIFQTMSTPGFKFAPRQLTNCLAEAIRDIGHIISKALRKRSHSGNNGRRQSKKNIANGSDPKANRFI